MRKIIKTLTSFFNYLKNERLKMRICWHKYELLKIRKFDSIKMDSFGYIGNVFSIKQCSKCSKIKVVRK